MKGKSLRREYDSIKLLFLAVSFSLHVLSAVVFFGVRKDLPLSAGWPAQFYSLLAASWILNIFLIHFQNFIIQVAILSTRILIFVLIGFPLGRDIFIETILLSAFMTDFSIFPTPKPGLVFSILLLGAAFFFQHPVIAWNVSLPPPPRGEVIVLVTVGSLVFLLSRLIILMRRKHRDAEGRAGGLARTVEQLTEANLGFQEYALAVGSASVLEERNRFSREIHDTIGYTLTNLIIMIEACQDLMKKDPEALRRMLVRAGELAQEGLGDTRRALHALRRLGVENVRGIPAIKKLVDTFQNATGIEVGIEYGNIPWNMNEDVERTLFRFIQEGMINAFKHGKAGRILISLWQDERHLTIVLQDNGTGSKDMKEGIGISGMRERVEGLGGEISTKNLNEGFELSARIPVSKIKRDLQ